MPIDIARTDHDDVSNLRIAGTLDANTAPELGPTIDKLLEERRTSVVVDLAGLELIDSSGVGALVRLDRGVRAVGGQVRVINVRDQPRAIFKLLRLDRVFPL